MTDPARDIRILYEDDSLLGIEKPAGMHSVQGGDSPDNSIASWLNAFRPQQKEVSPNCRDGGLVQRLDFFTSGVLIAAKTRAVWDALHETFRAHAVERSYTAVVEGCFTARAELATYLGSPHRGGRKMRVFLSKPGKSGRALPARTIFEPLVASSERNISVVLALPQTGRRHQIRVHAAHLGFPLVGDTLYGARQNLADTGAALPLELRVPEAFLLHAGTLTLRHPASAAELHLCSPLPSYLGELQEGLTLP